MATEKRLISLDEALEATHKEVFWTESEQAAVRSFLVKQPKVDAVEVAHGRWIVEDADSGEHGCYEAYMIVECSHCGQTHEVETGQFGWVYGEAFPFKYCPNCGASMRVGDGDG